MNILKFNNPLTLSTSSVSVQFSCSVMSNFLWPHGLQHTRLPCPSPAPRACSNSCQLSRWCHPTILSSVVAFSSCPQSFLASKSFPMSWLFISGGQNIYKHINILIIVSSLASENKTQQLKCQCSLFSAKMPNAKVFVLFYLEGNREYQKGKIMSYRYS